MNSRCVPDDAPVTTNRGRSVATSYALTRNLETVGVVDGERSGDCAGALAGGQAPNRFRALMFIELRLSTEPSAPSPGSPPAVVGLLHDALALILGECAQERDEASANRGGEIKVRLVEHLQQGAARVDALNDVHAVEHAARGAIPFRQDQDVALAERIDGLLELRAVLDVSTTRLLPEDGAAPFRAQRPSGTCARG